MKPRLDTTLQHILKRGGGGGRGATQHLKLLPNKYYCELLGVSFFRLTVCDTSAKLQEAKGKISICKLAW